MTKSIYFCLQRYLVKVLTKSCTSKRYNISLTAHTFNKLNNEKPLDLKLKKCQIRKSDRLNFNFSVISFIFLYKKKVRLKKWKEQTVFFFVKNSTINSFYVIKNLIFINQVESLYKDNSFENSSFFKPLFFRKLKKNSNFIFIPGPSLLMREVRHKKRLFFDLSTKKKTYPFLFLKSLEPRWKKTFFHKVQPVFLLRSFLNLTFFLCQQTSLQRKNKSFYLSNLFYIAFPLKKANIGLSLLCNNDTKATNFSTLQILVLPCVSTIFFFAFKYVTQKKLIQNTEYKAFVFLVKTFYVYEFNKKKLSKLEMKFEPQKVTINTAIISDFFLMRPLFSLTRLDTFYISESLRLPLYPDQSNFRVDFLRNRLRKQILPAIRILLNPQFDTILCKINKS